MLQRGSPSALCKHCCVCTPFFSFTIDAAFPHKRTLSAHEKVWLDKLLVRGGSLRIDIDSSSVLFTSLVPLVGIPFCAPVRLRKMWARSRAHKFVMRKPLATFDRALSSPTVAPPVLMQAASLRSCFRLMTGQMSEHRVCTVVHFSFQCEHSEDECCLRMNVETLPDHVASLCVTTVLLVQEGRRIVRNKDGQIISRHSNSVSVSACTAAIVHESELFHSWPQNLPD